MEVFAKEFNSKEELYDYLSDLVNSKEQSDEDCKPDKWAVEYHVKVWDEDMNEILDDSKQWEYEDSHSMCKKADYLSEMLSLMRKISSVYETVIKEKYNNEIILLARCTNKPYVLGVDESE